MTMRRLTAAVATMAVLLALAGCGNVKRPDNVAWLPQPKDIKARISPCEDLVLVREVTAARSFFEPMYSECWVADDGWRYLSEGASALVYSIEEKSGGVIVGEPNGDPKNRTFCTPSVLGDSPRRVDGYTVAFVCTAVVEYRGDEFAAMSASVTGWVLLNDTQLAELRSAVSDLGSGLWAPQALTDEAISVLHDTPVELMVFVWERDA